LLTVGPSIEQNNQVASEILLVDPKTELRDAQVQDLSDATYHGNTSTRVRAAEHAEAGQCDIIVVTAGAAQKKGQSSLQFTCSSLSPGCAFHSAFDHGDIPSRWLDFTMNP
jgi:malate/lactate dehydrogenase